MWSPGVRLGFQVCGRRPGSSDRPASLLVFASWFTSGGPWSAAAKEAGHSFAGGGLGIGPRPQLLHSRCPGLVLSPAWDSLLRAGLLLWGCLCGARRHGERSECLAPGSAGFGRRLSP